MTRYEGIPKWADSDERQREEALYLIEGAIEDYCETGDLECVIMLLRAGVPSQHLLDIAALELETLSRQPRRASKVKVARRKWERNWDIYYNMIGSNLFGRPESRKMRMSEVAEDLTNRHGIGSDRQVWEIYRKIRESTGLKLGRKR